MRGAAPATIYLMDAYHQQFCPVAVAADLLTRRWTPLVVRELLCGSRRFNDLHRGVPRMSRSLLVTRLGELERAGVVERIEDAGGHPEYRLTPAGEELRPIIMQLGVWGTRWVRTEVSSEQVDAGVLMWDVRRRIPRDALPGRRVVVRFQFPEAPEGHREFWLVLEPDAVDLCLEDPGYLADLEVTTDLGTFAGIWIGDIQLARTLKDGSLELRGPRELRRSFPGWLGLSLFADVARTS